jgi:hypothetical protein
MRDDADWELARCAGSASVLYLQIYRSRVKKVKLGQLRPRNCGVEQLAGKAPKGDSG